MVKQKEAVMDGDQIDAMNEKVYLTSGKAELADLEKAALLESALTEPENVPDTSKQETLDLFAKAISDPGSIAVVSKYVRTGRRWDCTHKDIVGKLIIIQRSKEITTRYGEAMLTDLDVEGVQKTVLMGGTVLIDQLKELLVHLPVVAIVRKPARAYALFDPSPEQILAYKAKYLV